jgi:cyclic pyranopterin phosphate synthase
MAPSEPVPGPAEPWWKNSFMVTFAFRCNIACNFCMVEDILDVFPGASLDDFRRRAAQPGALGGAKRIIFSGGEVTLSKELPDYARLARSLPGVEHVRIQTNAIRLADEAYLRSLIDAGIDEYFVSLHAAEAKQYDAMVQRDGSFEKIVAGMRAIARSGATLYTNTAIVAENHRNLADIVALAAPFAPRSMEFWNYWPRADEHGARGHHVSVGEVRPHLLAALVACLKRGISPVVKWYPRCLLGPFARYQDDGQPPALIDDSYWQREPEYGCLYEGVCEEADVTCSGLSASYVERFGWEEHLLSPHRGPQPERKTTIMTRSLLCDDGMARADRAVVASWLEQFELRVGEPSLGLPMVKLDFARAGESAAVQIRPRDGKRPCFARTRSFDFVCAEAVEPVARALVDRIDRRDAGDRSVPR